MNNDKNKLGEFSSLEQQIADRVRGLTKSYYKFIVTFKNGYVEVREIPMDAEVHTDAEIGEIVHKVLEDILNKKGVS